MAIIHGVNLNDARSLKALIDGNSASFAESAIGTALLGRVKYDFHGATATPTTVLRLSHARIVKPVSWRTHW